MNKVKLLSIVLAIMVLCVAAVKSPVDKSKEAVLDEKTIENSVTPITDTLYAGKYEVSNLLWLMFEKDLKLNKRTEDLKTAIVDSLNWRDKLAYNEPYVAYYYRHPAYNNYPVVNISYDGAVLFCKWLTEKYNAFAKRKFKKVMFRLPSSKEWVKAARGNAVVSIYPWGDRLIQNNKYMCNFKGIGDENITYNKEQNKYEVVKDRNSTGFGIADNADITAPVDSYFSNSYGLYNVCGNVAEMSSEKGKTHGGSWRSSGADVRIDATDTYTKSANDIGFRYFMEIVEK